MTPVLPLRLDDIALFLRIVELGTLSAAARERDVPVSQVTRWRVWKRPSACACFTAARTA